MQELIEGLLAEHGYAHYETSAFAQPGYESRHNSNYWLFGDYLGIGAGAHSKISFADRITRQMRWKHPREYLDRAAAGEPVQQDDVVTVAALPFEFMMNALRLTRGFPARAVRGAHRFAARHGPARARRSRAARPRSCATHADIAPTLRGQRFLNDLLQLFLRET